MPYAIAVGKFVGTISLGLLTGVSYTLSSQSLPLLLTLPGAEPAAYTLTQTTRLAALHITTLSSASFLGLTLAYALSPPRVRHPYLLWTALVAATSGSLTLAADLKVLQRRKRDANVPEINGEQVERTTRDRQLWEFLRTGLSGLGFAMAVVGIWGDGA